MPCVLFRIEQVVNIRVSTNKEHREMLATHLPTWDPPNINEFGGTHVDFNQSKKVCLKVCCSHSSRMYLFDHGFFQWITILVVSTHKLFYKKYKQIVIKI